MKNFIQWLVSALLILSAATAESSQLIPIEASKLEGLSDLVLVGIVKTVELDTENKIPKEITDYDIVTVEVAFVLKGTVATKEVKIRLATRGNKAFDSALIEKTTATFFLGKSTDGIFRTAYPGSVAVFPGHYKGVQNNDAKTPPDGHHTNLLPSASDATKEVPGTRMFPHNGDWVQAPDKTLSIRMSSDKAGYQLGEAVLLRIELRNDSTRPAELPSLEDESYPWIEGPGKKRIRYMGPEVSRPPQPRVTLGPGKSVTREVAVEGENWGRLETPGKHTASFSYCGTQSGAYKGLTSTLTFDVK